jgi:hypothetical protein
MEIVKLLNKREENGSNFVTILTDVTHVACGKVS